jgi:hypothetical protein
VLYEEYEAAVEEALKGVEAVSVSPCPGCADCGLEGVGDMDCEEYEAACEPGFSWRPCGCCGSGLGGERYSAHYIEPNPHGCSSGLGVLRHFEICADCVYYLVYGRLDDESMLQMDADCSECCAMNPSCKICDG